MQKNYIKYNSYRNANDQIKLAIASGFFLEAITIEESILADRLYRFCRENGLKATADRATLGKIRSTLAGLSPETLASEGINLFFTDLETFWAHRNTCLHQIVKSEPGEPTMPFEDFILLARATAVLGKELTKKVSAWAGGYKRKIARAENSQP